MKQSSHSASQPGKALNGALRAAAGIALVAVFAARGGRCLGTTSGSTADEPAGQTAAALADSSGWRLGAFRISGLADDYYSVNVNHPQDHANGFRNFDDRANRLELNMASIAIDRLPAPVGIHAIAAAGRAIDIMGATEKDATGMRFFEEAYVDLKRPSAKGAQLDLGKFDSWASAEVIETPNNWNYSRSLLFVRCTPYNHFGVRLTVSTHKNISSGIELVSGWNNIVTGATFRTVGVTSSWALRPRLTWTKTYYGGPDEDTSNRGLRHLYDSVLQSSGGRAGFYVNFDYLHDEPRRLAGYQVFGVAGAGSLKLTRKLAVSPRLEWLNDDAGMATGVRQQVKEFTATGRYALLDRVSVWVEFRDDWSSRSAFGRGRSPEGCGHQPTLLVGVVAILRPNG